VSKIRVATPLPSHANSVSPTEPWVDLRTLADHIGFRYQATRRMVEGGQIPGKAFRNGRKTLWRFQLSVVDAALTVPARAR
jgi:hypothetical protein